MSSRFRAIFLLMAILWQTSSILSPLTIAQRAIELEQTALHWQDANHHHHDDQSLHLVDAAGAPQHLHADVGFNTAVLLNTYWPHVATVRPLSPDMVVQALGPPPHLEGPFDRPGATPEVSPGSLNSKLGALFS